jgi:hypothetical protein
MYFRQLATELRLNVTTTVPVYEDNQSTIKIANNSDQHGRPKHIDFRHYFVKQKVESKEFSIKYVNTYDIVADAFTKALPTKPFEKFRTTMRINSLNEFQQLQH